jgi:hypothetical protein
VERTDKQLGMLNVLGRDSSAIALRSFLAFLQGMFKDGVFGYRWSSDRNSTDIVIAEGQLDGSLSAESVEKLPAIFVTEGPAQWSNMNAAAITQWELTKGHQQLKMPQVFTLVAKVVSGDPDEMKGITSTVFTALPIFPSLIGKKTGLGFPGTPVKQYGVEQVSSGAAYPVGVVQIPCTVMVGLDVTREKGSIFDTLLKSVTLSIEAALPELPTRRSKRFTLGNTPKDMLDVVMTGEKNGVPLVDDPCEGEVAGEGVLEQDTELRRT